MASNLRADLEKAIRKNAQDAIDSLTPKELEEVGDVIIDSAKDLISKGQSPIGSGGRFAGYKYAEGRKDVVSTVNQFTKGNKSKEARTVRSQAKNIYSNKYPFSVMKEFPNKRPRPVNLFLSGEFLKAFTSKVRSGKLFVGVFDKLSALKEQGHREGANGQAERPIIPIDGETFSTTIIRKVELKFAEIFRRKNKT